MIIHNPILTGSFTVNGTDVASITSSAASITALNAYTASQDIRNGTYTLTSSFAAQTASFTAFTSSVNTFTASQLVLNGTYATTGSNTFTGIQTVNSNLVVTGSITAQTLVVQTVTSSVDFVTGSTRFGSLAANTHQFTGSVGVEGIGIFYQPLTNSTSYLTVKNNRARNAAVYTETTNGGFYAGTSIGTDTFNYQIYDSIAGSARLTISSTGAATFSSDVILSYNKALAFNTISNQYITADSSFLYLGAGNAWRLKLDASTGAAVFSGSVGIGNVTPNAWASPFTVIQGGSHGQHIGFQSNGPDMKIGSNNYYNGSNYIYAVSSNGAAQLNIGGNSGFSFSTAPSGTAGDTVTFTTALYIPVGGSVYINNATTSNFIDLGNLLGNAGSAIISIAQTDSNKLAKATVLVQRSAYLSGVTYTVATLATQPIANYLTFGISGTYLTINTTGGAGTMAYNALVIPAY